MLVLGSKYRNYVLWVKQPLEGFTPKGDRYVQEKGICLKFQNGKCFINDPDVEKAVQENHSIQRLMGDRPEELHTLEARLFEASGEGYRIKDPNKPDSYLCKVCGKEFETERKLQMHNVGKHIGRKKKEAAVAA